MRLFASFPLISPVHFSGRDMVAVKVFRDLLKAGRVTADKILITTKEDLQCALTSKNIGVQLQARITNDIKGLTKKLFELDQNGWVPSDLQELLHLPGVNDNVARRYLQECKHVYVGPGSDPLCRIMVVASDLIEWEEFLSDSGVDKQSVSMTKVSAFHVAASMKTWVDLDDYADADAALSSMGQILATASVKTMTKINAIVKKKFTTPDKVLLQQMIEDAKPLLAKAKKKASSGITNSGSYSPGRKTAKSKKKKKSSKAKSGGAATTTSASTTTTATAPAHTTSKKKGTGKKGGGVNTAANKAKKKPGKNTESTTKKAPAPKAKAGTAAKAVRTKVTRSQTERPATQVKKTTATTATTGKRGADAQEERPRKKARASGAADGKPRPRKSTAKASASGTGGNVRKKASKSNEAVPAKKKKSSTGACAAMGEACESKESESYS